MRWFVSPATLPRPDRNAGDRRLFAVLEILARRHHIDLWSPPIPLTLAAIAAGYDRRLAAIGVHCLKLSEERLTAVLNGHRYDIGWFPAYNWAELVVPTFRAAQPLAAVVVDSVDVHYARARSAAALGLVAQDEADEIARREVGLYRLADVVVAASDLDAALLRAEGLGHVVVVPNILPIRTRAGRDGRLPEVLFVGGFAHPPNADGIAWFLREIWQEVLAAVPNAVLRIAGSDIPQAIADLAGRVVRIDRDVADIGPLLDQASVAIAPLRYGAGMKGKVGEALASGVPVVTTSVGLQGIPAVAGIDVLVADDPVAFAAAVVALLSDAALADAVARSGHRLASLFTPTSAIPR